MANSSTRLRSETPSSHRRNRPPQFAKEMTDCPRRVVFVAYVRDYSDTVEFRLTAVYPARTKHSGPSRCVRQLNFLSRYPSHISASLVHSMFFIYNSYSSSTLHVDRLILQYIYDIWVASPHLSRCTITWGRTPQAISKMSKGKYAKKLTNQIHTDPEMADKEYTGS